MLGIGHCFEFALFSRKVGLFGVGLARDGDIFPGSHRHCAGYQPGNSRNDDFLPELRGSRNADNQAGGGDDPVVGAKHRGTKPADALDRMAFRMEEFCKCHCVSRAGIEAVVG